MGTNTIVTVIEGTTGTVSQLNQYKTALTGDLLPRNAAGEIEDEAGSVGSTTEQIKDVHMTGKIYVSGTPGGFTPAGVMLPYTASETVAPPGWIFADGSTIGAPGSGADYENEDFRYLFNLYKVVTAYGNTGSEDFDSFDTVKIPNPDGYFIRSIGSIDPDSRLMGSVQDHNNAPHAHGIKAVTSATVGGAVNAIIYEQKAGAGGTVTNTDSSGSEGRPKNMAFPYIIKV